MNSITEAANQLVANALRNAKGQQQPTFESRDEGEVLPFGKSATDNGGKRSITVVIDDDEGGSAYEAVLGALAALKAAGAPIIANCSTGEECPLDDIADELNVGELTGEFEEPTAPDGTPEHENAETPEHERAEHAPGGSEEGVDDEPDKDGKDKGGKKEKEDGEKEEKEEKDED